ncbi:MAG: TonB-dependent receptor [Hyphomonadaceae bacterium]
MRGAAALAASTLAIVASISTAHAQEEVRRFDIPAQSLSSALIEFSRQSDVLVVADPVIVSGRSAPAVHGDFTPQEVLERLLTDTGLTIARQPDGGYVLVGSSIDASAVESSSANAGLDEIIVTATKRAESAQDVSLSMSVMQGGAIEDRALETLNQVVQFMPNVRIGGPDGPGKYVSIRGIGSGNNRGFETSVGLFQDGVYLGREYFLFDSYFDIARVEAIKGPQGALFGRNTIAGALSVITADPSESFEGRAALTAGENDKRAVDVVLSGPITDNLSARLAVQYFDRGGYMHNTASGADDGSRDVGAARLKFDWQANADLSLSLTLQYADVEVEGSGRQLGSSVPCVTFASPVRCAAPSVSSPASAGGTLSLLQVAQALDVDSEAELDFRRSSGPFSDGESRSNFFTALEANYALGNHTLTYIGSYAHVPDHVTVLDTDATLFNGGFLRNREDFTQTSHEVRLTSPSGGLFDYIAGVYYYSSEVSGEQQFLTGPLGSVSANVDQEAQSLSVFAQGTVHTNEDLRFILGGRWIDESKDANLRQAGIALLGFPNYDRTESISDDQVLLNAAAEYDVAEDVLAYFSYAQGYKAGGLNFFDFRNTTPIYGPETSLGYELGLKAEFFDRSLRINVAAYRTEYSDLQVSFFDGTAVVVGNAASATSEGVEIDVGWRATQNLTVNAAWAAGRARFDSYPTGPCTIAQSLNTVGVCVQDLSGRALERAPDQSGVFSVIYNQPLAALPFSLVLSGDAAYSGDYYHAGDLDPLALQDGYWLYGARVALEENSGRWALALVGKNLSNEAYAYVSGNAFGFAGSRFVNVGEARQIDLQLSYRW